MAAKKKQRKKAQPNWKETKYKDDNVEAENSREEEDADCGNAKNENSTNKAEELSLDEVLHLGGTRVRFLTHVYSG